MSRNNVYDGSDEVVAFAHGPEPLADYEIQYAMSETRTCPHCHGSGVEDQWNEALGPCQSCWGEGEV